MAFLEEREKDINVRVVAFALRFTGAEARARTQLIAFAVLLAAGLLAGMLVWGGR